MADLISSVPSAFDVIPGACCERCRGATVGVGGPTMRRRSRRVFDLLSGELAFAVVTRLRQRTAVASAAAGRRRREALWWLLHQAAADRLRQSARRCAARARACRRRRSTRRGSAGEKRIIRVKEGVAKGARVLVRRAAPLSGRLTHRGAAIGAAAAAADHRRSRSEWRHARRNDESSLRARLIGACCRRAA